MNNAKHQVVYPTPTKQVANEHSDQAANDEHNHSEMKQEHRIRK